MKPHPRLRRAALVSGAVVSVLLIAVWIGSAWWVLHIHSIGRFQASLGAGHLYYEQYGVGPPVAVVWTARQVPFDWRFLLRNPYPTEPVADRSSVTLALPLSFPLALSLAGTAGVWRLDARARRRARVGACAKCGYDRAGLAPEAPCPECGTPRPDDR